MRQKKSDEGYGGRAGSPPAEKIRPRWEEIFDSLGDGVVILDAEGRLIEINPAAERITGFSAESVLGRLLEEAFPENAAVLKRLRPFFQEVRTSLLREVPWKRRREGRGTIDLSSTPLIGEDGNLDGWILVFRDITPLKNLEEEVRKGDRLSMMGTIAAGLAHEIKNPLGGIKGAAQLLERERLPAESLECLKIIIRETERVDRLVGRLLTLTKPRRLSLEPMNLNELLDSILLLQKGPFGERKIRLVREFDPSLPPVAGDREALHEAFLNFIRNALEAIPKGGGEIRVRSQVMTNFKIRGEGKRPSRVVLTEIQDTGCGISLEDREKVFTPFFTTKEGGYGLGLAIAQRVIHEHGGMLRLQSEKGKGTTVQVFLRADR